VCVCVCVCVCSCVRAFTSVNVCMVEVRWMQGKGVSLQSVEMELLGIEDHSSHKVLGKGAILVPSV